MTGRATLRSLLAVGILSLSCGAWAQIPTYPAKTIRVVIGQSAGGAVDTVARLLAEQLSATLGQTVVVDNRPGASGMIAANATAKATPDGYTLGLLDAGSLAVNPVLQKSISYDVTRDFTYLGLVAKIPLVLAAHPSVPVSTLSDLTRHLKAHPGELSYASSGVGGPLHLAMETYKRQTNTDVTHVPYQGGAPALTNVVGGHVSLLFIDTNLGAEYSQAGKIKLIAVATKQRNPKMPDVPTFDEAGIRDFEFAPWVGLTGPAGMPPEVVNRLTDALSAVMAGEELSRRIRDAGLTPAGSSSGEFTAFAKEELAKYTALIRDTKISLAD